MAGGGGLGGGRNVGSIRQPGFLLEGKWISRGTGGLEAEARFPEKKPFPWEFRASYFRVNLSRKTAREGSSWTLFALASTSGNFLSYRIGKSCGSGVKEEQERFTVYFFLFFTKSKQKQEKNLHAGRGAVVGWLAKVNI